MATANISIAVSSFFGKSNDFKSIIGGSDFFCNITTTEGDFFFSKMTKNGSVYSNTNGLVKIISPFNVTYTSTKTVNFVRADGATITMTVYCPVAAPVPNSAVLAAVKGVFKNYLVAYNIETATIGFVDVFGDSYVGYIV